MQDHVQDRVHSNEVVTVGLVSMCRDVYNSCMQSWLLQMCDCCDRVFRPGYSSWASWLLAKDKEPLAFSCNLYWSIVLQLYYAVTSMCGSITG